MLLLDFLVAIRQRQVGCKRSREARSPNCWIAICKTSTEVDDLIDVCTASDYDVINDEAARTHVRHRCGAGGMMMCSKRKKATSTFHLLSLHGALCPPFRPVSANLVCRCATVSANGDLTAIAWAQLCRSGVSSTTTASGLQLSSCL